MKNSTANSNVAPVIILHTKFVKITEGDSTDDNETIRVSVSTVESVSPNFSEKTEQMSSESEGSGQSDTINEKCC